MTSSEPGTSAPRAFEYQRVFEAPRDLVFRAWTERDHLARWWGPKGMDVRVLSADIRPGGTFHYSMEHEGRLTWGRFAYREIVPPERIVWVNSFADAAGNVAPMPYLDGFPAEILNTATFTESAGRTTVSLHAIPLDATAAEQAAFEALFTSMDGGFGGTFDQLAEYLGTL
ncbi:MAG: SRPBCC domain-containing protein [Chloroflexota bacterium]